MQGRKVVDGTYLLIISFRILMMILVNNVKEDEVNATGGYFKILVLLEK